MSSPVDPRVETIGLLKSIDATMKAILLVLSEGRNGQSSAGIASDADLDGQHGDPVIKAKDPRDWSGPSMVGRRFSQCPAEYLDLLADRYDYFASKETDPKKARYNALDAGRARGWARRVREGKVPAPSTDAMEWDTAPAFEEPAF